MKMKTLSKIILYALLLVLICLNLIACVTLTSVSSFKSNYFKLTDFALIGKRQKQNKTSKGKAPVKKPPSSKKVSVPDPSTKSQPTPPLASQPTPPSTAHTSSEIKYSEELPDNVPILYKGWVKYFHYNEGAQAKPKTFFNNELYAKQGTKSRSIPSETSFFAVVYQDNVNFLKSRDKNAITTVWDTLQIDFIKSIPENNVHMGGIKDLGLFNEGSCFRVTTVVPPRYSFSTSSSETKGKVNEIWMICTENLTDQINLMNILIKLKLKKQHNSGVYLITDTKTKENKMNTIPNSLLNDLHEEEFINDPGRSPDDGYWVLMQDWTQCSQKCGGGKQVRQLMCIPPRKGGKPCEGKEVRERPCNTQPCPSAKSMEKVMAKEAQPLSNKLQKVEKPIVSVMSISKRPQRYDKCYLKDTDALMVKNDKDTAGMSISPKVPIRLVMNNKSVVAYQDENLTSAYKTFLLEHTQFLAIKDKKHCFVLQNRNDQAEFCQLSTDLSNDFVSEWNYDFHLFKNDCHMERETVSKEEQEEAKKFKKRLEQLKQEFIRRKIEVTKQASAKNEEKQIDKNIQQTQAMSMVAILKEQRMEELLEQEEKAREKQQMEALKKKLEEEKKRKECLMETMKEKSLEVQLNKSKTKETTEIEKIKEEAKKQILARRAQIKEKIQAMRMKSERRLSQVKNEILKLRTETAGNLQRMSREGTMSNCFNPEVNPENADEKIEIYCQKNFMDNFAKLQDCKTVENFCYACCENEFGQMYMSERESCYTRICDKTKEDKDTPVMIKPKTNNYSNENKKAIA